MTKKSAVNLHCGHSFCGKCINTWIVQKNLVATCPMCRANISEKLTHRARNYGLTTGILKWVSVSVHKIDGLDSYESLLASVFIPERFYDVLLDELSFNFITRELGEAVQTNLIKSAVTKHCLVKNENIGEVQYHMIIH